MGTEYVILQKDMKAQQKYHKSGLNDLCNSS